MIEYILAALMIGILAGYFNSIGGLIPDILVSDYLFNIALFTLLFVMGLVFGMDRGAMTKIRTKGVKILIIPISIALGSIVGGILAGLILGINVAATTAASGGFGWYTLAGPMMSQLFGVEFGALGFVVNFLRELLTILTVPVLFKLDKYAPVASGGATSMDTTLPVIVNYGGSDMLIIGFASGFILSILAPFVIIVSSMFA